MPLSSLLLALNLFFSAHGHGDTTLAIPPSLQDRTFAPSDDEWQHLVELDESRQTAAFFAKATAATGGGLLLAATIIYAWNGFENFLAIMSPGGTENDPSSDAVVLIGLAGLGMEVVAGGGGLYYLVEAHQLHEYEHRTRYRLSFEPLVVPTRRAVGAVARVGF